MRTRLTRTMLGLLLALSVLAVPASRAGSGGGRAVGSLELRGRAFGTTWTVTLAGPTEDPEALAAEVRGALDRVDRSMSTWRRDSELARFNALRSTSWWRVAPDLAQVVKRALDVYRRSEGAFDPSVAPVLALWGFGPGPPRRLPPSPRELELALTRVGLDRIRVRDDPPALKKLAPDVELDLSGVAKGHAVDAISERLESLGVRDFLVEVGGELRGRGNAPSGERWQVAIERPLAEDAQVGWTVALSNASLATSGSYRNYFEARARRYPHVVDPRDGQPVEHRLVSVSVLAPEAARADAWATALLVMGPVEGWRVAEREGLAVLFVVDSVGGLEARATRSLGLERRR